MSAYRVWSVEQAKSPKGDPIAKTYLGVINGEKAIGKVLDLVEVLAFSADLKGDGCINKKITLTTEGQAVSVL